MSRLKRLLEIATLVVGLPLALLFFAGVAIAVGVQSIFIYTGALLAAWLFSAIVLPIAFGAMSPAELVDGYQSRRRHEKFHEGESLRGATRWFQRYRSHRSREKFYPLEPHSGPRQGFPFWQGRYTTD
jgi:hypothetical protein